MIDDKPSSHSEESQKSQANPNIVYKIGDLAREFDVTLRTLRFYEDRGLIVPARAGTTRLYSSKNREELRLAVFGKRIGLSLKEIGKTLKLNENPVENQNELSSTFTRQLDVLRNNKVELENTISALEEQITLLNN